MSPLNSTDSSKSKVARLRDRASMLKQSRHFFDVHHVTEVDCPLLSPRASIDAHIDLIPVHPKNSPIRYLHSSPEYGMKRLLAQGLGDIFQLAHVFRDGESSHKHNPEFMMCEWYRLGFSLDQMIQETVTYIQLFLGPLPHRILSYRELFKEYAGIDYLNSSEDDLMNILTQRQIPIYPSLKEEGKDTILNLFLGYAIEPLLGNGELLVLTHYPATQAALAQKKWIGHEQVAERFEIYYQGVELCNGYHELANEQEQRERFHASNQHREQLGKDKLPIDELFLECLKSGLPQCCGVAVGVDRLIMLRQKQTHIDEVIPFSWDLA